MTDVFNRLQATYSDAEFRFHCSSHSATFSHVTSLRPAAARELKWFLRKEYRSEEALDGGHMCNLACTPSGATQAVDTPIVCVDNGWNGCDWSIVDSEEDISGMVCSED